MIKYLFFLFIFLSISTHTVLSQEISEHSIGLRLSNGDGFWAEASYQNALSTNTRVELGLALQGKSTYKAIKLTGIHQWLFTIDNGLNWYTGPGIGGGALDYDTRIDGRDDKKTFGFITGNIGIEYNFDFPLLISFDFRPEIYFDSYSNNDISFNFGLSARYQFN
ncbi:hypothetical protein [Aquimarina sp. I32.4]|uniref:hypothetical protein n=1 Tax=Aquimarina sp. I32.4 TaxID=2053903 RepID=UPI000CDE9FA6|nr:hypothetical protein [Aquimarina sp. I32.4]